MRTVTTFVSACALTLGASAFAQGNRYPQDDYRQQAGQQQNQQQDQQGQRQYQREPQQARQEHRPGRQQQAQQQARQQAQQPARQQARQQAEPERFEGRLTGVRQLALRDHREDHVLGRIALDDGRMVVVDLGPVSTLRDQGVRLRTGQDIAAEGYAGRLNDRPIVIAYAFETPEQTVDVSAQARQQTAAGPQMGQQTRDDRMAQRDPADQRQRMDQRDRMEQRMAQQDRMDQRDRMARGDMAQGDMDRQRQHQPLRQQEIRGELIGYRTVNLRQGESEHVLAKVRTDQGRVAILDLGTVSKLRDQQVDLERGMQISTRGGPGRLNGKPILVVSAFALTDQQQDRTRRD
jgi:hypothetical protein